MSKADKQRGLYNSSSTRVEPAFDVITKEKGWFKFFKLVRLSARNGAPGGDCLPVCSADGVRAYYGSKDGKGGGEMSIPPNPELLHWLIDSIGTCEVKKPRGDASDERKRLFEDTQGGRDQRQKAHGMIQEMVERRCGQFPREWFVLEGATRPDVYIETDSFILLIEGKRTEDHFTRTTTWMRHRDQMVRHMDAAYPMTKAPDKPVFGLYILSNQDDKVFAKDRKFPDLQSRIDWYYKKSNWLLSLPHRNGANACVSMVDAMMRGFLGYITWNDVAAAFPDVKNDFRWS